MENMVQYRQSVSVKKVFKKCEVFAFRKALEQAVSPLTILTDDLESSAGLRQRRGALHVGRTPKMQMSGRTFTRRSEELSRNWPGENSML